jgi:hypothetical protein
MNWWKAMPALAAALVLLAAGCGGDDGILSIEEPGPPVGEPLMPDIAPAPALDAQMSQEDGRWLIRFSTILVNIGEGDFVLRAARGIRDWKVEQDVHHSKSGADVVLTPARLVWGGDGHGHWHVERIAVNRLVPLDAQGRPAPNDEAVVDSKIGFCFYDFSRQLDDAPQEEVYSRLGCGTEDDTAIGMGLSMGWADVYPFGLPGQSVDVTDLPDGGYRLWTEVDENAWFREARRDNNTTWVNLALSTKANGAREVKLTKTGPIIQSG